MAIPKKQSDAEQIEQLSMLAKSYLSRPTFNPGDFVIVRPETIPAEARGRDVRQIAVVLETVESLREFSGDKSFSPGQGILIASTDHLGNFATNWHESWQYTIAPPDLIASFIGQTTH